MPTINALTGNVRLLKADERILSNAVTLVDFLTQNFEAVFDENAVLSEALEKVRDPLAIIMLAVEARLKPAVMKPSGQQQGDTKKKIEQQRVTT